MLKFSATFQLLLSSLSVDKVMCMQRHRCHFVIEGTNLCVRKHGPTTTDPDQLEMLSN